MKKTVTTNADSGAGSLRQAIIDINNGSTNSNAIHIQIPKNTPIILQSDLPVIKKNTEIVSTDQQTINGNGKYRLFATIMADLTLRLIANLKRELLLAETGGLMPEEVWGGSRGRLC